MMNWIVKADLPTPPPPTTTYKSICNDSKSGGKKANQLIMTSFGWASFT